jgi:hypothetical protein
VQVHALTELLERQGKLEGRDYQVANPNLLTGLKIYAGDWDEVELPSGWTHRVVDTIADPEGDDQMDVLSIEIYRKGK